MGHRVVEMSAYQPQDLGDAEIGGEPALLGGEADSPPYPRISRVPPKHTHRAGVGEAQTGHDVDGGCLPGPVGSEDGVDFALSKRQVQTGKGLRPTKRLADSPEFYGGFHGDAALDAWRMVVPCIAAEQPRPACRCICDKPGLLFTSESAESLATPAPLQPRRGVDGADVDETVMGTECSYSSRRGMLNPCLSG